MEDESGLVNWFPGLLDPAKFQAVKTPRRAFRIRAPLRERAGAVFVVPGHLAPGDARGAGALRVPSRGLLGAWRGYRVHAAADAARVSGSGCRRRACGICGRPAGARTSTRGTSRSCKISRTWVCVCGTVAGGEDDPGQSPAVSKGRGMDAAQLARWRAGALLWRDHGLALGAHVRLEPHAAPGGLVWEVRAAVSCIACFPCFPLDDGKHGGMGSMAAPARAPGSMAAAPLARYFASAFGMIPCSASHSSDCVCQASHIGPL